MFVGEIRSVRNKKMIVVSSVGDGAFDFGDGGIYGKLFFFTNKILLIESTD